MPWPSDWVTLTILVQYDRPLRIWCTLYTKGMRHCPGRMKRPVT